MIDDVIARGKRWDRTENLSENPAGVPGTSPSRPPDGAISGSSLSNIALVRNEQ